MLATESEYKDTYNTMPVLFMIVLVSMCYKLTEYICKYCVASLCIFLASLMSIFDINMYCFETKSSNIYTMINNQGDIEESADKFIRYVLETENNDSDNDDSNDASDDASSDDDASSYNDVEDIIDPSGNTDDESESDKPENTSNYKYTKNDLMFHIGMVCDMDTGKTYDLNLDETDDDVIVYSENTTIKSPPPSDATNVTDDSDYECVNGEENGLEPDEVEAMMSGHGFDNHVPEPYVQPRDNVAFSNHQVKFKDTLDEIIETSNDYDNIDDDNDDSQEKKDLDNGWSWFKRSN